MDVEPGTIATQTETSIFTPWMTTAEAAAYLRCSRRTLEGYRNVGGGPEYCRTGGRVFYHREDLDAWRRAGRAAHTTEEKLGGRL